MTNADDLERLALNPQSWPPADIAFAASQLQEESPNSSKDQLFAAVNSASPFVLPAEGRVQLVRRAREFVRSPA